MADPGIPNSQHLILAQKSNFWQDFSEICMGMKEIIPEEGGYVPSGNVSSANALSHLRD